MNTSIKAPSDWADLQDDEHFVFGFRHGQTDWNAEGRIQGHIDIPLNAIGRNQAKLLVHPIRNLKVQELLASDLSRALETAQIIGYQTSIPISSDQRLREVFLGTVQGKTKEEIGTDLGHGLASKTYRHPLSDADVQTLGGESSNAVWVRATSAIKDFFTRKPHIRSLALASHGGVLRRLILGAHSEKWNGPIRSDQIGWIANCAIYPFVFNSRIDKWSLRHWLPTHISRSL